jgi:pimeloyl-ACP methyl ester carboxylesterase
VPPPTTRYAKRGDISIAFQVTGEGPVDLVLVNGLVAHMDLLWAEPEAAAMLRRLGRCCRIVLFDKPGTGLSDPVVGAPTLEQRMEDVLAVMDAAGVQRAFLLGYSEGGAPAALLAATHPARVRGLILASTVARFDDRPDPEYGLCDAIRELWATLDELAVGHWGEGRFALVLAPSWRASPAHRRLAAVAERASASPGMVRTILAGVRRYDLRDVLPAIRVPTVVLHPRDEWVPVAAGRDLAARIPGARFVELPGVDHIHFAGDWRPLVAEIEAFVTGVRPHSDPDRVMRTILFSDIAGSTERLAALGDRSWRAVLELHDRLVREQVAAFGGRVVKDLGDGHLAAFEGAARAVRCARVLCEEATGLGVELRAGVHSGECETIGDDLAGMTVHIGARIGALASPSEVLVSGTVRDLVVGSGLRFADRGERALKGVPGRWRLLAVVGDASTDARAPTAADDGSSATPGAAETMRPVDRAVVRLARHAPWVARGGLRLSRRT